MTNSANTITPSTGFFSNLLNRRVPQIVGFYLGGSWGILQFFIWIVERYLLSPRLVELAMTILGSLLPSIVVLAYCHGAPGKNRWHKSEKIFIPINLLLTVLLVFTLFSHKSFDSITRRVAVTDETGKEIKKVVPKTGSIKNMTAFYIENQSEDKSLNWLQYGITEMLQFDLMQNPFVNIKSPSASSLTKGYFVFQKFKEAGYEDGTGVPLMFRKKIAGELNSKYFLSGNLKRVDGELEVKAAIYQTQDTKKISEKIFKNKNIFTIVDEITIFIKKTFKLPSLKNDEIVDLPIAEIYTKSEKAARLATLASMGIVKQNDYKTAQKQLEEAVKVDGTFTIAYSSLASTYALNGNIEKWKATYKTLMKFLYKLPDKMQFRLKASYYIAIKEEPEKAVSLLKMLIKLYPGDLSNYSTLASHLAVTGNFQEAIKYYKQILSSDPGRFDIYKNIGAAYENMSDMENALVFYKKYLDKFPKKLDAILNIGQLLERNGKFEEAIEYYEGALLLDPEDISTSVLIAGLNIKTGNFPEALTIYNEALKTAITARDKTLIYSAMAEYYSLKGQPSKELEYTDLMIKNLQEYTPPLRVLVTKILTIDVLIKNNKQVETEKLLDSFKKKLTSPYDKLISLGYILVHIDRGEPDKAEPYVSDLSDFVKKTGTKQFMFIVDMVHGDIKKLRGNYNKALVQYNKVLKYNRNSTVILDSISLCYRELNKYDDSLETIQKALKISPFNPTLNTSATQVYFEMGKQKESIKHLKLALKVWQDAEPGFKPAKSAKENMDKYLAVGEGGK
ncbi:tetratricopeptide repeat protein [Acidobacteriota bacterium]